MSALSFAISPEIIKLLPRMQVVVVTARNVDNHAPNPKATDYAAKAVGDALVSLKGCANVQAHPMIAQYRAALKEAVNLSPKKFPQSNESLYRRVLKTGQAPNPINPLVDFYNGVSLRFGVTAGAFDAEVLKDMSKRLSDSNGSGNFELRLSGKGDGFRALDAAENAEPVLIGNGELTYALGNVVLTRHLAWRQAREALVTDTTVDVVFVSEILAPGAGAANVDGELELATKVKAELLNGLKEVFGVEGTGTVLGAGMGEMSVAI